MFPNAETTLVLGGPGCGKTTALLNIMAGEIERGVSPSKIAFVSFTKQAATEARTRAAEQFKLDAEKDLPWVRTIHSLAFGALALGRDAVMDRADWAAVAKITGEPCTGYYDPTTADLTGGDGDKLLRVIEYAAAVMALPWDVAAELDIFLPKNRIIRFVNALNEYKRTQGKMTFSDMLAIYLKRGTPIANIEVAIIDEAQDLTRQQWCVVAKAFAGARQVFVAGDDDQAIYKWAGADVATFLSFPHQHQVVLAHSYRLGRDVHAFSQGLVRRLSRRYEKVFAPSDHTSRVEEIVHSSTLSFGTSGSYFLLARNNYQLSVFKAILDSEGINYTYHNNAAVNPAHIAAIRLHDALRTGRRSDLSAKEARALLPLMGRPKPAVRELSKYLLSDFNVTIAAPWYEELIEIDYDRREYYRAVGRRGDFGKLPRVRLDTIHGVKGGEADHVIMLSDISSATEASYWREPDTEHRVFYVGATRARTSLTIVAPSTPKFYPMELV